MRVVLLCDGGGQLGVGHVMRSLALAEAAVVAGHEVVVAGRFEGSFVLTQLAAAPVEVVQIPSTADAGRDLTGELFQRFHPDVLHIDSYDLSRWFMGSFLLSSMEDGPFGRRGGDVVIDPTPGSERSVRSVDPNDRPGILLRGSRYAPIRQRVLQARRPTKAIDTKDIPAEAVDTIARSVLVVMGGTDPVGLAPAAVGLLARTGLELDVTVIAVGENADRVRDVAAGSRLSLNVLAPVNDLAALMSRQDLVVSAAGTSVWELCCIGVPMAVVCAVDNQRVGYDRVVAPGAAVGLGGPGLGGAGFTSDGSAIGEEAVDQLKAVLTDSGLRAELVRAGRHLIDGLGAWRVVRTWEQAVRVGPPPPVVDAGLVARPAVLDDARRLWQWRNDPQTRACSRTSDEVPWPAHLAWLESSLARTDRLLLIVEDEAGPVGTVRWDLNDVDQDHDHDQDHGEWEVSITVAPDRRGQSLARPLLRTAEVALSHLRGGEVAPASAPDVSAYLAVVHADNGASLRLFETSGYVPDLPPDPRGFLRFHKVAPVA